MLSIIVIIVCQLCSTEENEYNITEKKGLSIYEFSVIEQ